MGKVTLRPFADKDLPLMEKWLSSVHVKKWFESSETWLYEVNNRNGKYNFVKHFIAEINGIPAGFCQYYDIFDAKELWYEVTKKGKIFSIDYLIGEPLYIGHGYGREIIALLVDKISEIPFAKQIIVQPEKDNNASIGVLKSFGFNFDEAKEYYYYDITVGKKVNFYRLDSSQNYRIEGGTKDDLPAFCLLTDGKIESYSVKKVDSEYRVDMLYVFYDKDLTLREAGFQHKYSRMPKFFEGQNLMIAFNDDESVIINQFELNENDIDRFLSLQESREDYGKSCSNDEIINVDIAKGVTTAEDSKLRIKSGLMLISPALIWIVFFSVIIRQAIKWDFYFLLVLIISFTIFLTIGFVAARMLIGGIKAEKYVKNIIENNPVFVKGKLFSTQKTYRIGEKNAATYCYLDAESVLRQVETNIPALCAKARADGADIIVVYDKFGNSAVVTKFS